MSAERAPDVAASRDTIRTPTSDDQLGHSWDNIQERVKAACFSPSATITTPYNVATLTMDQLLTTEQASATLGYSAGTKAKLGMFGVDAKAKFARSLASSQFSISNYFAYSLMTQKQSIDVRTEPTWLVGVDDPDWYTKCGDQYLQEKTYGGQLLVLYRIDFASESDKQEFSASVGGSWNAGASTINGEVNRVSSVFRKRASIHLEALQIGGDATQLASIVGGSATDAGGGRVVLDCTLENLAPCGTFMQNAVNYSANAFAASIRAQPQFREEMFRDFDGLRVVTHPSRSVPLELRAARLSLLARFDAQLAFSERVATLKSGRFWVPDHLATRLDTYAALVATNLDTLNWVSFACWEDITDPLSADQINACVAATQLSYLVAAGYTDGLTMGLLDASPAFNYQVGIAEHLDVMWKGQWLAAVSEGTVTGKSSTSWWVQALRVSKTNVLPASSRVCYQLRIDGSWRTEVCDGAAAGEVKSKFGDIPRVEQLRIRLVDAPGFGVCYRIYNGSTPGPLACDGTAVGTPGKAFQSLAIYSRRY